MFNIEKFDEEDYRDCAELVEFIRRRFEEEGNFYYFVYNDDEKILYKAGNTYCEISFAPEEEKIVLKEFVYDLIEQCLIFDYKDYTYLYREDTGYEALLSDDGIYHSLSVTSRHVGYEGYAIYSQYNSNTGKNAIITYDHHYVPTNERQHVFEERLTNPRGYILKNKVTKKDLKNPKLYECNYNTSSVYGRVDIETEYRGLAVYHYLIKKYGIKTVADCGARNLLTSPTSCYYKMSHIGNNGFIFPFVSKICSKDEIERKYYQEGFRASVPEDLIDIHNRTTIDIDYLPSLAKELFELEVSLKLEKNKEEN